MAPTFSQNALALWANGQHVGVWSIPTRSDMELQYSPEWIASAQGRALSLSLPMPLKGNVALRGHVVAHYFENLLPDSEPIRKRLASRFKTKSTSAFDLLTAIGRDCVGALQLLPPDARPTGFDTIEGAPMSEQDIEQFIISAAGTGPVLGQAPDADDFRISIAGAHEKTALLFHNGRWLRPLGATPTTHILKLPLGMVGIGGLVDMTTSVENEWLCSKIVKAFGLPVAETKIQTFGSQKVLVVNRFDRRLHSSGTWWMRLPQEDFCQAKGVPPNLKYDADGGPGAMDVVQILQHSVAAKKDLETFFSAQVIFWALGATDGHAKNFSLQIEPQGRYKLAPLYDILSIWPHEGPKANQINGHKAKLAMGIPSKNKHFKLLEIQRRHFHAFGRRLGMGVDADALISSLIERTPAVVEEVRNALPAGFPESVSEPILTGLTQNLHEKLGRMPVA